LLLTHYSLILLDLPKKDAIWYTVSKILILTASANNLIDD